MDDEKISGVGGAAPDTGELKLPRRGNRRSRKLSGVEAAALGDLAFVLYEFASLQVSGDTARHMLRAKLLAWRARYI